MDTWQVLIDRVFALLRRLGELMVICELADQIEWFGS